MFAVFVRAEAAERAGGQVRGENRQLTPSCSAPFLARMHMCDTQTHMHTHAHKCIHRDTRAQTHAQEHMHAHTQAHMCTHKHTRAHTSINTYTWQYTNTYRHKYIHAHMHILGGGLQLSSRSWLAGLLRPEVWAGPHVYEAYVRDCSLGES